MTVDGTNLADETRREVVLDVTATLDDQLRYNEYLFRLPMMRRRRLVRAVLSLVVFPVAGLLIGFVASTVASGRTPTFRLIRDMLREDVWLNLLLPWALLAGLYAAIWILWRVTLRSRLRRLLRRQILERPGVDPADPTLGERVRCRFGPQGYRVESPGYTHEVPWAGIKGLDETPDLLIVRTGLATGYLIPKRDIPGDRLADIKRLAVAHGAADRL